MTITYMPTYNIGLLKSLSGRYHRPWWVPGAYRCRTCLHALWVKDTVRISQHHVLGALPGQPLKTPRYMLPSVWPLQPNGSPVCSCFSAIITVRPIGRLTLTSSLVPLDVPSWILDSLWARSSSFRARLWATTIQSAFDVHMKLSAKNTIWFLF